MLDERLAGLLPDIPRWVEARSALMGGSKFGCAIFGLDLTSPQDPAFVLRSDGTLFVVGRPAQSAIEEALDDPKGEIDDVLATNEVAEWVAAVLPSRLVRTGAILHTLANDAPLARSDNGDVRIISISDLRSLSERFELPKDLREELDFAHPKYPIVAAFEGDAPVAFSYAGSATETLWDLSIDTLEGHRRRGHAARCASFLIQHLFETAQIRPIWGAVTQNAASLSLARKLGFKIVDEIAYFESA